MDVSGRVEAGGAAVAAVLDRLSAPPYGQTTPSPYETARLVSLAPWLDGHRRRLRFLAATQRSDGGWGGADGYAVVPTLSATEALLTTLRRHGNRTGEPPELAGSAEAAKRGLDALLGWLGPGTTVSIPDTIAAELLVPQLVRAVNRHLDALASDQRQALGTWPRDLGRLGLPNGMDDETFTSARNAVTLGAPVPVKLWHSLEFLGPGARGAARVEPTCGVVGGSAAATAAWLGGPDVPGVEHRESLAHLRGLQAWHGGPVPGVCPITVFEHAWVLMALADAVPDLRAPAKAIATLRAAIGPDGAPAGPGLPADSDDTAAVLYVLARLGSPRSVDCLWRYEGPDAFECFTGERTPSTSTNAHVLDALVASAPGEPARRRAAVNRISGWLLDHQEADGRWWDKWHASPYYATSCCTGALARAGRAGSSAAIGRAVAWVLATQRPDGSWGRWAGTVEETSYAIQILLHSTGPADPGTVARAVADGCAFLLVNDSPDDYPPLWHDKDLYAPVNVIAATRVAALRLASARPLVARLMAE
ncbi:prenyltransferase/squalene oxidase repeat-containing protein [Actinosynnema sp. NPDC053489]|uniref:prenyltransferase/squalene oxidase repeat-containing protein n=1 Tax=Actinosynnema sp. NPDC053489 TaxID=3363916 RepID=UPI0037CB8243